MNSTIEAPLLNRVGLIGYPVEHSLSPKMHRAAFAALGLNGAYSALSVRPEALGDTVTSIRNQQWRGFNVTVPHKQAIRAFLDSESPDADLIGAVNTVVLQNGRLMGYNTDWIGFLEALKEADVDPVNCRAVLLGAGGAARAVLYALLQRGATVTIANRNLLNATTLAAEFRAHFDRDIPTVALYDEAALQSVLDEAILLVNSTSVGMSPDINADPLPPNLVIPPHLTVYDLVYNPRDTQLLKRARAAGAIGIDGQEMLVHQGAEAFRLWTGLDAPVDVMRRAIE